MIYVFYSYKGGVGRSMALANVGELFYQSGLNVLLVDWDLEAPGLERFFDLDLEEIVKHPGVMDMLLDYKHQMTQEWSAEAGEFPFTKPSDLVIDLHPPSPKGSLRLLTAGRRDKTNFARYANSVLTFDWKDFYENWEGEAYFEWLRRQFLEMADVVLIDSRTGITEMGGVCTYQLADVVVMFCGTSGQNLEGTAQMVADLKSSAVEKARGRPLEVLVVPARVDKESGVGDEFKREFLQRFARYTPEIFRRDSDYFWQLTIPYSTVCAYKEMIVRPESSVGSEDVYKAFARLTSALSRLTPKDSKIRKAMPETQISVGGAVAVGSAVAGNIIVMGNGNVVGDAAVSIVQRIIDPDALHQAYLSYLFESVGRLSLAGIDLKAVAESEIHLNLEAIYTAPMVLSPETAERTTDRDRTRSRLSALACLDREARLVLLGDPGSGKTTFINFVALCLAGEALGHPHINLKRLCEPLPQADEQQKTKPQPWRHGALLPVKVILRDFAARGLPPIGYPVEASTLWDFIEAELSAAALPEFAPYLKQRFLETGGLLLLDGLDEVPDYEKRRDQVKRAIEDFAATFPKCRIVVTCRPYAYQQPSQRLLGFTEAVLAPFDQEQIVRFVDRWYAHLARVRGFSLADAQDRAELLKRAIFASERLLALAERPMLLTLMASLHAWRGSLPEKRAELYADVMDLLLDWWEAPKVVRDQSGKTVLTQPGLAEWLRVSREEVRGLLEQLAYAAQANQPSLAGTADISEREIVWGLLQVSKNADVNPGRLVEYLCQRAGLLVPRGAGVYTFPHRVFQEYLAACYLTDHDYPDRIAELVRQDPNRWREVALLTVAKAARGSRSAVWAFVDALCYADIPFGGPLPESDAHGALLAGQALVENAMLTAIRPHNQPKVERVRRDLAHILQTNSLNPTERAQAGVILAHIGDPRFRSEAWYLPEEPLLGFVEIPAGPFVMGSDPKQDKRACEDERPQHMIELFTFYIARYPVTIAQFRTFVEDSGYKPVNLDCLSGLDNHPVTQITWFDALAYCQWLTERLLVWEGTPQQVRSLLYEGTVRLPTEAEWEKASRGTDARIYPWGDELDPNKANYEASGIGNISAVGCFPAGASPYGVEDLSGNVWEWTLSSFREYPYDSDEGGKDLDAKMERVLRGGAFDSNGTAIRCAARWAAFPDTCKRTIGFRVVLVPRRGDIL